MLYVGGLHVGGLHARRGPVYTEGEVLNVRMVPFRFLYSEWVPYTVPVKLEERVILKITVPLAERYTNLVAFRQPVY